MDPIRKIAIIDNIVQAQLLESMLNEQNIPHVMTTYHDSAYDGLFQGQKGWGHIEASTKHEGQILELLENLRSNEQHGNQQEKHDPS